MDIRVALDYFIEGNGKNRGRKSDERYASFDYCYNYFYSFYKENKLSELTNDDNLQLSCFQIGFYLASWGMLRGSSFLLEKSARNFKNLIEMIANTNSQLWEIDLDSYSEKNISLLLDCKRKIINALGETNNPSDTLITKIMLGVFANVPAFDQYVRKSFHVSSMNKQSLLKIKTFYENNKDIIDSYNIYTYEFLTGGDSKIKYTKAKLLDMYGFIDGMDK